MEYRSKSDIVADSIKDLIRAGEFDPGTMLRQRDLAERFNVSPTPVREALRRLEAEGFVTTELHRGATVVRTEEARLEENFRIRSTLESLAAEMATQRMTDEDLEEITRLHDALAASPPGDPNIPQRNRDFHFRIYECARSPVLGALLNLLWGALNGGPTIMRKHEDSMQQHDEILEALRARDSARCAEATRLHIEDAMRTLRDEHGEDAAGDAPHLNGDPGAQDSQDEPTPSHSGDRSG